MPKSKWIIYVNGEATEVFEGSESAASERAYEMWLDGADQDYHAAPYTRKLAVEEGLEDDGE